MDEKLKSDNKRLIVELADATRKIEKLEDYKKFNLVTAIKRFGNKYNDLELESKSVEELENIADACSRFMDEDLHELSPPVREEVRKIKRIDFSRVFDDVAKTFNMTSFYDKDEK